MEENEAAKQAEIARIQQEVSFNQFLVDIWVDFQSLVSYRNQVVLSFTTFMNKAKKELEPRNTFQAMEAEQSYLAKKQEMEEAAERRAAEAEARAVKEAEERELEMERLREQMARDRDEENRQTEADRNRELQEQLKVIFWPFFAIMTS